jgi:hypothetical protein
MAFDGTYTYYNDGYGGSGNIYKLDPTGAVVATASGPDSFNYTGIAYLNGKLYADAPLNLDIYVYDASTLNFLGTISTGISDSALVGLAGDPDRGVLWAVGQNTGHGSQLYEIDATTGAVIQEAPDNSQGAYEQDIAYANGVLVVSDTTGVGTGHNFLDEYNPDTLAFIQRLTPNYQGAASGLAGDGVGGRGSDWYQFNVNAGDNLVLTTTTPGVTTAGGLQLPNDLYPTLNLYDASGNLVASATGNAADGRNDVIDWTALTSGSYRVQIVGARASNVGEYTISVQGATGGLSPFSVTATTLAAGSDIGHQVSSMTVSLSSSVLLSSVSTSDFTIDGNNATGVTVIDDHTVEFAFPTIADGVHSVSISGLISIQGASLAPDSFTFTTDDVPPAVVSSSIANGAVLPPGTVTEVVTFSKPIQPSSVGASDIALYGEIRGLSYTPASINFDPTDTILTITYSNVPTDAYQFTLEAGPHNFLSDSGVPLPSNDTINFVVQAGTSALGGLQPINPPGSLVYEGTVDNVLTSSSDVDTYNLAIDPHQTISVVLTPVSGSMEPTVDLYSPKGVLFGSATSPSPGAPVMLPAVQSSQGGTYQIVVYGGPGEYRVQAVLNALIDPSSYGGAPDNSIATAQPIDPYANNFIGQDSRTAVIGTVPVNPFAAGNAFVAARYSNAIELVSDTTGQVLETIPVTNGVLSGGRAGAQRPPVRGRHHLVQQRQRLRRVRCVHRPGPAEGADQPAQRHGQQRLLLPLRLRHRARRDVLGAPAQLGEHHPRRRQRQAARHLRLGPGPRRVGLGRVQRAGPDRRPQASFAGQIEQLDPATGNTSVFSNASSSPEFMNPAATGGTWVGDFNSGALRFNSGASVVQQAGYVGTAQGQTDPAGNVWTSNFADGYVFQFSPSGSSKFGTSMNGPLGLTVLGVDGPAPPPARWSTTSRPRPSSAGPWSRPRWPATPPAPRCGSWPPPATRPMTGRRRTRSASPR